MDKKKVTVVVSILVIILSVVLSILIITNKKEEEPSNQIDGITLPETKDLLKDTTVENLKITNISLLTRDGKSTYKAQVVNDTDEDIEIDSLYVIFYEGENQKKIPALKYSKIAANNKTYISISSESDLSKTEKIEYVIESDNEQ